MAEKVVERYLKKVVQEDLGHKMVFIGGPRQVGKTTFALGFLANSTPRHPAYLSWNDPATRAGLLRGELPPAERLLVFDEIHKFGRWRSLLKGFYDRLREERTFLITGSARLDHYSKGGDSLQGRYFYFRLHPFSLGELGGGREQLRQLLRFGGFPEPLLRANGVFWRRWQRGRAQRVIYEDIRDLETVAEISLMELLAEDLPHRVGSPLSIRSLSDVLQVSHKTAERWIQIFERMYLCFRLPPFGGKAIRAVKKEQKLYLWDWSLVPQEGARFENLVASHLLKYCHFREDSEGYKMELRYIRDTDRREVDFVVLQDGRPLFAVEAKSGERSAQPALFYFMRRTDIPRFYQVHTGQRDYEIDGVRVLPFEKFADEVGLI